MQDEIMFVEFKGGALTGPGRICRVRRSKTGKTLYLGDRALQSLKGRGYKANYFDLETLEEYWVSRPKKNGQDTLYPGVVAVDEDVREEYWLRIRGRADFAGRSRFRSEGKHCQWRTQQYGRGSRTS